MSELLQYLFKLNENYTQCKVIAVRGILRSHNLIVIIIIHYIDKVAEVVRAEYILQTLQSSLQSIKPYFILQLFINCLCVYLLFAKENRIHVF